MTPDNMRVGPDGRSEANCNGHAEVEERQSNCTNEDQHNGNSESPEELNQESPVHPLSNGVESTDFNELYCEMDDCREAHSSGVSQRLLPAGLEEGELERSILQDEGDETECHYRIQDGLRNGQSVRH